MKVKLLPHYTVEDWERWEGRWELIEGIPYSMLPMRTPKHQRISLLIGSLLEKEKGCEKCVSLISVDWVITEDTVLEPDNLIVCSDDLIYEEQGVKYYVTVDPEREEVEVYQLEDGKYKLAGRFQRSGEFTFDLGTCGAKLNFSKIWR